MEDEVAQQSNQDLTNIWKALSATHKTRESENQNDFLRPRIMAHVQEIGPHPLIRGDFEIFQKILWQLTPFAALTILILTVLLMNIDVISDYELTQLFVGDPINLTLISGLEDLNI